MIYLFDALPYLAVFFIAFLTLVLFNIRIKPAAAISVIFSLALNLTLTFLLELSAIRYAYLALTYACKSLPYVLLIGLITFLPNAKKLLSSDDGHSSLRPQRIVLSAMLTTLILFSLVTFYNKHPLVLVSSEYDGSYTEYIDRDELVSALTSHELGSMTLYIRVINASEEGYSAEATYFPFGDKLGLRRYRLTDGTLIGEYYDPD